MDTTGAGDAFIGSLLRKLVDNQSVIEVSDLIFNRNLLSSISAAVATVVR